MSLDFTPRPAAAPPLTRIWAQARMEATLILRNGEQALLAVVIPVAVLVGAAFFGDRLGLDLLRLFGRFGRQARHVNRRRIGGGIEAEHIGGAFEEGGWALDFALVVHVIVPRHATMPRWMNSATSNRA